MNYNSLSKKLTLHTTLFALHTPYSKFCKDDLIMDNWPKQVVKVKIKIKRIFLCFTVCFLLTHTTIIRIRVIRGQAAVIC